jgi:BioD-like phosphotransacetylase family protein
MVGYWRKEGMMLALFVTSIERYTGKDLITMGLIDRFRRDGFKVGYFKPMGHYPIKVDDAVIDKAAWLFHRLFQLEDAIDNICPVVITQDLMMDNYREGVAGLQERIEKAFKIVSEQKDIVVVSCDNNFSEGSAFGLSGIQLIKLLNAHALFVERYECDFSIDFLLELKKIIDQPMIGVVFNKVESLHIEEIKELVSPFLNRKHMAVFGTVPRDTLLGSIGVNDLVDHLGADVVCSKNKLDALVEKFLVGGMQVDRFITYLLKTPAPGIIVGGDRTDIQLVAIENGVKCLILSGNLYPNDVIIARAEAKGVPILVARDDTYTIAKKIEAMVGQFRLKERVKIDHGIKLVDQMFDFERLYETLNLVPR